MEFFCSKNKVVFYKVTILILILISAVLWSFSLYHWGDYVVNGIKQDRDLATALSVFPDYQKVSESRSAAPLEVNNVASFPAGGQALNLYAEVYNPNPNFYVDFDYHFVVGNTTTSVQNAVLMAGERSVVVYFNYDNSLNGLSLVFDKVNWHRVSAHEIKDPLAWQQERLNFVVSNFSLNDGSGADLNGNQITLDIKNDSAYGYKDAKFVVVATQGGSTVAVYPLTIFDFKSLETRSVDIRSYGGGSVGNEVFIFPMINIYDRSVYLSP